MSFFLVVLQRLKALFPRPKKVFYFDDDLTQMVEFLAEQERRPPEEVVADLVALALAGRSLVEEAYLRWQALTVREQQIAALVCLNYSNPQIGDLLGITQDTVRCHQRKVLSKFHLRSKSGLRRAMSPSLGWDFKSWEADHFVPHKAHQVLTKLIAIHSLTRSH